MIKFFMWGALLVLLTGGVIVGQRVFAASTALQDVATCPDLGVPQDFQVPGRTVRLAFIPGPTPTAGTTDRLEAGRLCLEAGAVLPVASDACPTPTGDTAVACDVVQSGSEYYVHYLNPATIYLEAGQLSIKRLDKSGTLIYLEIPSGGGLQDATKRTVAAGETISLKLGEAVLLQDVSIRLWNPDTANTTTLWSVGVNSEAPPDCGGVNCWIPS